VEELWRKDGKVMEGQENGTLLPASLQAAEVDFSTI
jgi:hypothetical protein